MTYLTMMRTSLLVVARCLSCLESLVVQAQSSIVRNIMKRRMMSFAPVHLFSQQAVASTFVKSYKISQINETLK